MISMQRWTRILIEVSNGAKPPEHESEEEAHVRARLKKQVDEIHAKGGIVDIPYEG